MSLTRKNIRRSRTDGQYLSRDTVMPDGYTHRVLATCHATPLISKGAIGFRRGTRIIDNYLGWGEHHLTTASSTLTGHNEVVLGLPKSGAPKRRPHAGEDLKGRPMSGGVQDAMAVEKPVHRCGAFSNPRRNYSNAPWQHHSQKLCAKFPPVPR